MKLFFATDLHGSYRCFKKFLAAKRFYGADLLILGGDLTGKGLVPIVSDGDVASYKLYGRTFRCKGRTEIAKAMQTIQNSGLYPVEVDEVERDDLTSNTAFEKRLFECIQEQITTWNEAAQDSGTRVYLIPGNDDASYLDDMLKEASSFVNCDRRIVELVDGWTLVGFGGSNFTPWKTFREFTEDEIFNQLHHLMKDSPAERCIWNVHVPPVATGLDLSERIDEGFRTVRHLGEPEMATVGSHAVKRLVQDFQPLLGLFGHVHEARGWKWLGRTLCINPGSEYFAGTLNGCLVEFDDSQIRNFQLTRG